jgi:hypothetical protein
MKLTIEVIKNYLKTISERNSDIITEISQTLIDNKTNIQYLFVSSYNKNDIDTKYNKLVVLDQNQIFPDDIVVKICDNSIDVTSAVNIMRNTPDFFDNNKDFEKYINNLSQPIILARASSSTINHIYKSLFNFPGQISSDGVLVYLDLNNLKNEK